MRLQTKGYIANRETRRDDVLTQQLMLRCQARGSCLIASDDYYILARDGTKDVAGNQTSKLLVMLPRLISSAKIQCLT